MNNVTLMGRLARDPYISRKGVPVARFTVVCDRPVAPEVAKQNDADTADFIPCVAFKKNVDFAEKYMKKGGKFAITGSVRTGKYTAEDGSTVYTVEILAKHIEFAGGTTNSAKTEQMTSDSKEDVANEKSDVAETDDDNASSDFLDIDDDDVPVE